MPHQFGCAALIGRFLPYHFAARQFRQQTRDIVNAGLNHVVYHFESRYHFTPGVAGKQGSGRIPDYRDQGSGARPQLAQPPHVTGEENIEIAGHHPDGRSHRRQLVSQRCRGDDLVPRVRQLFLSSSSATPATRSALTAVMQR